ncbi:MAG: hotdog domain-containing protein [Pseudomonadales bacterium]|jgi:predicted thioesterase|nr:hotdog domain-containing protein [Pseudomonadales bacterium]MDP6470028.1 hotdog domain-containing protein [Pseudomonadales bacterium]MDP6826928.1 hotdog domain-containing protein [Pseudomonadales bacterium]MDP6971026.1 hotdog domain-containing protein [Pseudomonadales bacterium]|tara:strand:+ start:3411 stop:3797 length:387 start_codon:yes stop_codon:yes gene_type:complete
MSESLVGLSAELGQVVSRDMLAVSVGSGSVAVFATPELILLLEKTAVAALEGRMEDGTTTVGSALDVTHLAATPEGMEVTATAEVVGVEGRKLEFQVSARDAKEKIAEGTHTRFVVDAVKFQDRADSK